MWNKKVLANIILDKKKLKYEIEGSCTVRCLSIANEYLTKTEYKELKKCLNRAVELLRKSYIRSENKF